MLEPITLTEREREMARALENRRVRAESRLKKAQRKLKDAEAVQTGFFLCFIERAGGDVTAPYQVSEDGTRLVPVPSIPSAQAAGA